MSREGLARSRGCVQDGWRCKRLQRIASTDQDSTTRRRWPPMAAEQARRARRASEAHEATSARSAQASADPAGAGATIYSVADRAGVSIATVSRVLQGAAVVSETTRRKVLDAVDALNYVPLGAARS